MLVKPNKILKIPDEVDISDEAQFKRLLGKSTYLPKGVKIKDMDTSFVDFIKNDMKIEVGGEVVPVFFFTLSRYSEFEKNWIISDKLGKVKLPFITIVKTPIAKQGTAFGDITANLPTNETFTIHKVQILHKGKQRNVIYQIPQPTLIDLQYEVNIFTTKQNILNTFNEKMLLTFNSVLKYVKTKNHDFQILLSDVSDTTENTLEERRYYKNTYSMDLKGYLLDESTFKKMYSFDKINITQIINCQPCSTKKCELNIYENKCDNCYSINFPRNGETEIDIEVTKNLTFIYDNQKNSENYTIKINGEIVGLPFNVSKGDTMTVINNRIIQKNVFIKICLTEI